MLDYFELICSKVEEEKEFLNVVSQEIWKNPELCFKEFKAHDLLCNALSKNGFQVTRNYLLKTAFKAEYTSEKNSESGPSVAILLEYDALPGIGHACGHNLIAESGLASAIAVKEIMDRDKTIPGKLIVLGTPAEEGGGGKIRLIEKGAFENVDVALMVHPARRFSASPTMLCNLRGSIEYIGKESHASFSPWEGVNALDAAVICYNSLSVLRQQIRPDQRIHVILTKGGVTTNIIPEKSQLQIAIRTTTASQIEQLRSKVEACIKGAAIVTGCKVNYHFDEAVFYKNLISNKVLTSLFRKYIEKLGMETVDSNFKLGTGSSDMGNVSQVVPAFHPFFPIPAKGTNHTEEFTEAAALPTAQTPTLAAAKAMAMTVVSVLRYPDVLEEVKKQFKLDIEREKEST